MGKKERTLNLGAGDRLIAGAVNHDRMPRPGVDAAHDLDVLPWPWEDEAFDVVVSWAVFEHLHLTLVESLDECWRILRPSGVLKLKVPAVEASTVADDPTHIWRGWTERTFDFFDPTRGTYGKRGAMYGIKPWRILHLQRVAKGNAIVVHLRKVG